MQQREDGGDRGGDGGGRYAEVYVGVRSADGNGRTRGWSSRDHDVKGACAPGKGRVRGWDRSGVSSRAGGVAVGTWTFEVPVWSPACSACGRRKRG